MAYSNEVAHKPYVKPLTKELRRELKELAALGELEGVDNLVLKGQPRAKLLALAAQVDPADRASERVTLKRELKRRKVRIPRNLSTRDLMALALDTGCFGRQHTK